MIGGKKKVKEQEKKMLKYQKNLYKTFTISLFVPVTIIIIVFMVYTMYFLDTREEQRMSDMVESVSRNIYMKLEEVESITNVYYSETDVFNEAESMNNIKLYQYYDSLERSKMETEYSKIITNRIYMSSQPIKSVVFFPMNEMSWTGFYIGKDQSTITEFAYSGYHKADWFVEAIENPNTVLFYGGHSPDYFEEDEKEVYSCVRAIKNLDNNRIIGVVKVDVDMESLQESLEVMDESREHGFILSKKGEVVVQSAWLQEAPYMKRIGWEEKQVLIEDTELKLTYLESKSQAYKVFFLIFILMILIIMGSEWLAFLVYRRQTQEMIDDVRTITEVVGKAGNGNLGERIQVSSQNEMKEIGVAINKMMDNLQEYIEKEYLLVIQNQKAEYRALQSQINPHFLYNTLNGFVALNRMGETKTLEKSIISLAQLFRYTCKEQDVVNVESELEFLKRYLELEKLKYENRLDYSISMDEESGKQLIPKLLLQPVVENSIVHGMGMSADLITIVVDAICQEVKGIGKVCIIQVSDNGCGFDNDSIGNEGERHIGVNNVQSRAELFCKNAIYYVKTGLGKGTITTFVFPIEEKGEEEYDYISCR